MSVRKHATSLLPFIPCLFVLSMMMVACSSIPPTGFTAASNYGELGYADKKLSDSQYQIIFTGNAKTDSDRAQDYALLHAANLTMQQGYNWFEIIDKDTEIETKAVSRVAPADITQTTTSTCGVLGCAVTTASNYEGAEAYTTMEKDKVISTLLIGMGSGNPANPNRVFNAAELSKNLKNSLNL